MILGVLGEKRVAILVCILVFIMLKCYKVWREEIECLSFVPLAVVARMWAPHSEDSQENLRLWTVGTPANSGWNTTRLYSLHIKEVRHRQLILWLSDVVGKTTSDLFLILLPFKAGRKVDRVAPAVAASFLGKAGLILKLQTSLGKNSRALREVRGSVLFHGLPWWLRW